eukprot:5557573-Pleurochrysis_carterae.AAC.3
MCMGDAVQRVVELGALLTGESSVEAEERACAATRGVGGEVAESRSAAARRGAGSMHAQLAALAVRDCLQYGRNRAGTSTRYMFSQKWRRLERIHIVSYMNIFDTYRCYQGGN